jgi:hypothetical protein
MSTQFVGYSAITTPTNLLPTHTVIVLFDLMTYNHGNWCKISSDEKKWPTVHHGQLDRIEKWLTRPETLKCDLMILLF